MRPYTIAVLPGDGIGPEVVAEAERVLEVVGERFGITFILQRFAVGAAGVAAAGDPLPDATRAGVTRADAVLLGAVGDPALDQAPWHLRPESGLLALRARVRREYPDVHLDHLYVDTAAMRLVSEPTAFDVILTENLFGDILSDEAAVLAGSLGMLPSASLGGGPGLFEPIHGSAPDIAGRGVANPIGAIASVALLLRHGLGLPDAADAVDRGIEQAIEAGARTRDIAEPGGPELGTRAMGERIAEAVRNAECGVRSGDSLGDSALRIPHSALK